MTWLSRRPPLAPERVGPWRAFVDSAEVVEAARRRLLAHLPVGRVTPGDMGDAVAGMRLALLDARSWLPGWDDVPELLDDHRACMAALDEALRTLDRIPTVAASTSELEELQLAVDDVVSPLDAFADAERTWRRTWRLPRD